MKKETCFLVLLMMWASSLMGQNEFEGIPYPFPVKKLTLSTGDTMAYMDEGSGEVLVFIHGLGSYGPAWEKNIAGLRNNFRCIVVDLIGYGKSSKTEETYLLTDQSAFVQDLMQQLEVKGYHLVGHSMGGQIAIHHAHTFPEYVKSLILVAPAGIETFSEQQKGFFEMITPTAIAAASDTEIEVNLKKNFYSFPSDAQFMIDDRIAIKQDPQFKYYSSMVVNGIRGMVRQPVAEILPVLKVPTLVIYGEQDELIPNKLLNPELSTISVAESAGKLIPQATIELISQAGHMLMFERSEVVNRLIRDFIE
ncbi:alpha/beta fold hydrolase [Mongoliitalea daihaiensis]|uniref:alpha/beta fold hydrolase n=1 Tax=Mongoliitalea daihaiensis TaxID=2782006 RepID=UPI001F2EF852|nr:alpha/beta hydrolase [Mongoliitalea daihaiensis]UJP64563.1 alpha/beta hydrolase [Mongoliitalea daihaiensis]